MNNRQIVLTGQIMLINDNCDDRDLTIRALRKHHILNPVTVASDGAEALTMLLGDDHRDQGNPALILLDLNLPKIDGLEVLRRIRADQQTRVVPVLILTPGGKDEDLCAAYDLGANGSIRQPIAFSQFSEAVHVVGLFWLLHPPGRLSVRKAAPSSAKARRPAWLRYLRARRRCTSRARSWLRTRCRRALRVRRCARTLENPSTLDCATSGMRVRCILISKSVVTFLPTARDPSPEFIPDGTNSGGQYWRR